MLGRKGFTLLELLIAAVLVGVLTMFATQTFRQSARDVRIETAKRGADTIATAIYRYSIAYPNASLNGNLTTVINQLVDRGFLDNRSYWDSSYFSFSLSGDEVEVRENDTGRVVYTSSTKGFVQTGY